MLYFSSEYLFLLFSQMTALYLAANRGRLATVKYLVMNRADINIKDDNGVKL